MRYGYGVMYDIYMICMISLLSCAFLLCSRGVEGAAKRGKESLLAFSDGDASR